MFSSLYEECGLKTINCHKNLVNRFIIISFHTLSYYTRCCNTNKKWKQYKTLLLRVLKSNGEDLLSGKRLFLMPPLLQPYAYFKCYCNTLKYENRSTSWAHSPLYLRNYTQSHGCCLQMSFSTDQTLLCRREMDTVPPALLWCWGCWAPPPTPERPHRRDEAGNHCSHQQACGVSGTEGKEVTKVTGTVAKMALK